VRVSNDESKGAGGFFSDLLRLQTEFQARLTEETLTYLRRLQGAAAPAAPGTVLVPEDGVQVSATGLPGSSVTLALEIENRQRVHTVVTPMLGPLVNAEGITWFPTADPSPASTLVAPGQVRALSLNVSLPESIRPGTYRGALLLQGFGDGGVAIAIEVPAPEQPKRAAARRRSSTTRSRKRT
jgi:hypothetical protein